MADMADLADLADLPGDADGGDGGALGTLGVGRAAIRVSSNCLRRRTKQEQLIPKASLVRKKIELPTLGGNVWDVEVFLGRHGGPYIDANSGVMYTLVPRTWYGVFFRGAIPR